MGLRSESEQKVADPGFVHLHLHSSFSLLEGALPIARLAELAKADRQPALALTDTGNLFGALEFSEKMAVGRHPADHRLRARRRFRRRRARAIRRDQGPQAAAGSCCSPRPRTAIAISCGSCRRAFSASRKTRPRTSKASWLAANSEGLIALTGGPDGPLDLQIAAGRPEIARARLDALAALYPGRLYVELQRHGTRSEARR